MKAINEILPLQTDSLPKISQLLTDVLTQQKLPRKEINRTKRTAEIVLKKWLRAFEGESGSRLQLRIYKRFGFLRVLLRVEGHSFNPLRHTRSAGFSSYEERLLAPMRRSISYNFADGMNEVEIKIPTFHPEGMTFRIMTAVLTALVLGPLGHMLLPPGTGLLLVTEVTEPLVKTMLGLLSGVAGAMIFISLVAAICNMGDISTFSHMGGRVLRQMMGRVLLATALALPAGLMVFDVLQAGGQVELSVLRDVYKLVLGLVPRNVVAPFVKGDTMQMIMLALLLGYTLLLIGQKVRTVVMVINELNDVVMSMLNTVCRLLPGIVFLSLFNLLLKGDLTNLLKLWKLMAFNFTGIALFLLGSLLYICRRCQLSPGQLMSHIAPVFTLGATTMSSPPCLPLISRICQQVYSAEHTLCSFAVPFGQQLYMPFHAINLLCYILGLADIFDIHFSLSIACMVFLCCNIMVYTIPPIPMGIMTVLALLLNLAGIPAEGLALVMSVDFLMAMARMGAKVAGLTAETILLDRAVNSRT